ncbi:hypothetical protein [Plantactinospora soyae]|uniref:Membrane protein implicated in regulation of membrane protease activity n=1 Tax=Plantactinospora soyae TaxID=1544732 RepID=A0A927MDX8_9ACTN|nr:hypothetical protein [Plantactinospora soyae]MBE1491346.1 membrane protein implicated in regulation of membrane protease activity [Plantactinospora soyae]
MLPVIGLALLAPWVPEYLVGSHTVRDLPLIIFLVPLYGGGALLIRELARRTGRGWPTILLLGLAYGVVEAGLFDQSLFNPDFMGENFGTPARIPGLGVSAHYLLVFVGGHAIWSIGTPIAIIESLVPDRADRPWLRTPGLLVVAGLYLLGGAMIYTDLRSTEGFGASGPELAAAGTVAVVLVGAAFLVRRRPADPVAKAPPRPWRVLLVAFLLSSLLGIWENWYGVALGVAVIALTVWYVTRWARSPRWSQRHRLALASGALLTWAWHGFVLQPWREVSPAAELASDIAFALAAIALVVLPDRRLRRARSADSRATVADDPAEGAATRPEGRSHVEP